MNQLPPAFWCVSATEILQRLETATEGLSSEEARQRLARYGSNLLEPQKRSDVFTLLLAQFKTPLILILWFATELSFFYTIQLTLSSSPLSSSATFSGFGKSTVQPTAWSSCWPWCKLRLPCFVMVIFAINVYLARPVLDSFLFSLALAVGLTPQLLPAIININLAHGAKRMAQAKVIVKQLASIENLGSMNVICADKTGTLTEGIVRLQSALGGSPRKRVI